MVPNPAIGNTLMGYEPIVDRARKAIAMRITARGRSGSPADLSGLYNDFRTMWPDGATPVLIRNEGETLPPQLVEIEPIRQVWIEVPAALAESPEGADMVTHLHRRGFVLVLGGRPTAGLPGSLLSAFRMSIIDYAEDRRLTETRVERQRAHHRTIPYAQSGVKSIAMLKRSFDTGAVACIGWPFDDALQHAVPSDSNPDFGTITQLLSMIERDADAVDLEKVIRRDAALAYRLLRYINSAAFGLTVEIQSFRHAVMMLGYERLKRWLLLMLMTASKEANMQPVMFASFRRGLFMENLVGDDDNEPLRDEVFILGVLSLLDKLFREPLAQLLEKLYVPDSIREALVARTGPYVSYLGIAESVEHPPDEELARRIDDALLSIEQCNRALVKAVTVREVAAV